MAIVTPGKRPCDRIAQSKVLEKKFNRGKRGVYAGLTLTSLVDVMTIIVIFLLMNFSANGEVLYMSKDIKLPDAYHGSQLDRAPVISVSPEAVTFDGRMLLNTADLPGMRRAWSGAWAGLCNTQFWVDRTSGVCGSIYSNFLPFVTPEAGTMYQDFERALYASL